ncbi:MAG TPA: topoisomerase C-terminal repeat-containing protein, partial [Jatrophihabitans sp.]|uniref:topoisomerase C-terminal repeat-containing protein n=1 Tax=Jatrophihabitans sp. TaxID=1932789 RepID=UPI002F180CB9
ETGREITGKNGRFGPYVTDGERTASLFKTMSLDTLSLEDAVRLLTLPRVVGIDPTAEDPKAAEITAQNGRYGPYIKRGSDSRSLDSEEQLFTVTLDEALAIFAQPKLRGRQAAAAPPLKELGVDPVSQKPMVVKDGRFGPYVTDGETNASLRRDDSVEALTDERASELLADRRARGPAKKVAKRAAKKAPAKKAAAKKVAAKKAPAKKVAAKKA